jgi:hypothetical protein
MFSVSPDNYCPSSAQFQMFFPNKGVVRSWPFDLMLRSKCLSLYLCIGCLQHPIKHTARLSSVHGRQVVFGIIRSKKTWIWLCRPLWVWVVPAFGWFEGMASLGKSYVTIVSDLKWRMRVLLLSFNAEIHQACDKVTTLGGQCRPHLSGSYIEDGLWGPLEDGLSLLQMRLCPINPRPLSSIVQKARLGTGTGQSRPTMTYIWVWAFLHRIPFTDDFTWILYARYQRYQLLFCF